MFLLKVQEGSMQMGKFQIAVDQEEQTAMFFFFHDSSDKICADSSGLNVSLL